MESRVSQLEIRSGAAAQQLEPTQKLYSEFSATTLTTTCFSVWMLSCYGIVHVDPAESPPDKRGRYQGNSDLACAAGPNQGTVLPPDRRSSSQRLLRSTASP